jgi:tRNA modification GTPase
VDGDVVEAIGVERTQQLIEAADVLVWLGEPLDSPEHPQLIKVHGKSDLPGRDHAPQGSIALSSMTGEGIAALLEIAGREAASLLPPTDAIALNRRQAEHLGEAANALSAAAAGREDILVAEDLRQARNAFDRLTGRAGVEDLLDTMFGRFCLGK